MAVMLKQKGKVTKLSQEAMGKPLKIKEPKYNTLKVNRPYINLGYTQGYG